MRGRSEPRARWLLLLGKIRPGMASRSSACEETYRAEMICQEFPGDLPIAWYIARFRQALPLPIANCRLRPAIGNWQLAIGNAWAQFQEDELPPPVTSNRLPSSYNQKQCSFAFPNRSISKPPTTCRRFPTAINAGDCTDIRFDLMWLLKAKWNRRRGI